MMTIITKAVVNADIKELQKETAQLELRIKENVEIIESLKTRLHNSLQADEITRKQEVVSLKRNLSEALKLRYLGFQTLQNLEYNQDSYDAAVASVRQVFRVLKRYDIDL